MSNISQIQVDRTTYNICDSVLRNYIDHNWISRQWNVYETDDGTNITEHSLSAKTMNSSNHPYTSYQNYTIFEERKYNMAEAHDGILLCNSVQFLSGNSTSGSANTLASAVFEGISNEDSSFTFSTTASPTRYQLQYVSSGLTQRDHWMHFKQLDNDNNYYHYHYGMMSSIAKSITDTATNYIQIRGWILTKRTITVGGYGSVFYGESFDDKYGTKTITIVE